MDKTIGALGLMLLVSLLAGCGADGPPQPPGAAPVSAVTPAPAATGLHLSGTARIGVVHQP